MGWVLLAQFNPSGNRGKQLKTDENTEVTVGNKLVTAGNKLVTAGNREKAIRHFNDYDDRVNLGLATRFEHGRKGRINHRLYKENKSLDRYNSLDAPPYRKYVFE